MWKRFLKYDDWLATNKPLRWLCRFHIIVPLLLLLFLISALIPFIVPIWTNFKIIIFINLFFAVCTLFLLYRFQFLYYDKALSFNQHVRLYLFNSLYLFLLLFFVLLSPVIMQMLTAKKLGIKTSAKYDYTVTVTDSTPAFAPVAESGYVTVATDSIISDTIITKRRSNPGLLSNLYIDQLPDTSWINDVNESPQSNMCFLILGAMDTNEIETIRDYFDKSVAADDNEKNEIIMPALRSISGMPDADWEAQKPTITDNYELSMLVRKAINTPTDKWNQIIKLADSLRLVYELPKADSANLNYIVFEYYPVLLKRLGYIIENSNFINTSDRDFDSFIIPLLIILLINIYGMIVLMARNRLLGLSSLFIFLLIIILVYSVSFISSSTGYMKYVFITGGSIIAILLAFSLLNKKIRTSILSHVFIYLLNYLAYIVFWALICSFYWKFVRKTTLFGLTKLSNSWLDNTLAQVVCMFFLLILLVFLNYPFLKFYYNKNIRPAK
jgi:hypothetical protein